MTVVPMGPEHLGQAARIEQACFSQPWSEEALRDAAANPSYAFFAALEGERVAGYCGMYVAADEGYIANVAVLPEFRRKGIGAGLMCAMEVHALERKLSFLTLEVRVSNRGAIALYEQAGFEKMGVRRRFYIHPDEDGLVMTKRFGFGAAG